MQSMSSKLRRLRHSNETAPTTYLWIGFRQDHKKVVFVIYILLILVVSCSMSRLCSAQIVLSLRAKHGKTRRRLAPWRVPKSAAVEAPTSTDHNEPLRQPLHLRNSRWENRFMNLEVYVRDYSCASLCIYVSLYNIYTSYSHIMNVIYYVYSRYGWKMMRESWLSVWFMVLHIQTAFGSHPKVFTHPRSTWVNERGDLDLSWFEFPEADEVGAQWELQQGNNRLRKWTAQQ